jgi:hypothetical protein
MVAVDLTLLEEPVDLEQQFLELRMVEEAVAVVDLTLALVVLVAVAAVEPILLTQE